MTDIHAHSIAILDFGSQYTQLIARRIREIGVFSEIFAWDAVGEEFDFSRFKGVVLSGGPESVASADSPRPPKSVYQAGIPVLGVCYGMQVMASDMGGEVQCSEHSEFGYARIKLLAENPLTSGISDHHEQGTDFLDVWMSHGDRVEVLPNGFDVAASTPSCPIAMMVNNTLQFYGIQFHPEVTHTLQGTRILRSFVVDVCRCDCLWTPAKIVEETVARIRQTVGTDKVLLGLSGGVDSSVTAALLSRAIGDQLVCVFVDNGLLRKNEASQVLAMFGDDLGLNIVHVNAEQAFLSRLAGESDPEKKRKIIGNTFVEIFDQEAGRLTDVTWLSQGTIYPDVIESAGAATGKAHVIKSHHNVGGLPKDMKLKLLEPLRELFKDEVRKIGLELGLPYDMVYRHPFPGPGLGVRILGEVKKEYADLLREADAIFMEELRRSGYYDKVSQAFVVFLPVKSVGVVGDGRRYEYVVAVRAVETVDFMTARWAHLPYELLATVSNRIINEISGISRVTYDISGKPPATIEWE